MNGPAPRDVPPAPALGPPRPRASRPPPLSARPRSAVPGPQAPDAPAVPGLANGEPFGALLAPVTLRTAGERIAERLVTAIALGEFVPGQRLPAERDLAAMLEVSRTTGAGGAGGRSSRPARAPTPTR
jgi:hypothetical protein